MTPRATFLFGFLGGIAAIVTWQVAMFAWRGYGWWSIGVAGIAGVGLLLVANIVNVFRYWWAGRQGLDQWPDAHGRYYDEWMQLPEEAGDYYDWLAEKMGGGEPWSTWARAHQDLQNRLSGSA